MPPRPGAREQVAGKLARCRARHLGKTKREQDGVRHGGGGVRGHDRAVGGHDQASHCHCEPADGTPATAANEQDGGHGKGRPRGRLHGRGQAERQPGRDRPAPLVRSGTVSQRQPQADKPQHGQVVPADGHRQGDDRRGGDQDGPPAGPPYPGHAQRRREGGHERDAEPEPWVGEQPPGQRARQTERDQRRQVRVVGHPGVCGRERPRAGIGRPRVRKHLGGTDDDLDFGLRHAGRGHPGQRGKHGAGQAEQHGERGAAAAGQHDRHGGDGVADGGQLAPQPFRGLGSDQRRDGSKDRGQAEQGGQPFPPDHGECHGGEVPPR